MGPQAIRDIVLDTIHSVAPETDVSQIPPDRPLREAVELDSMDWLNVVCRLEERLSLEIPPCDHARLSTLDVIVDYIASRQAQGTASFRPSPATPSALPSTQHVIRGVPVVIRPMRDDDMLLEAEFVRHLSSLSRYKRFMVTLNELPPAKLEHLTHVDQDHHVAFVAQTLREGEAVLAGVVRYVVDASGTGCEFAVAIDDAWQGSGLAGILMHTLMAVARSRGLATMEGLVLRANDKMLKLSRQLGFRQESDPRDRDTVRVVTSL